MSQSQSDQNQRRMDAFVRLLLRQGDDKTTMQEVAEEARISRGMVYRAFATKDHLLTAVVRQEIQADGAVWETVLAREDARGSLGSLDRAVLAALTQRPLDRVLLPQDRRMLGRAVHQAKRGLPTLAAQARWPTTVRELQVVGALRRAVNPDTVGQLLDVISAGMMTTPTISAPPSVAERLDLVATVLDRALLPADGVNPEAGRAVLRALSARVAAQVQAPSPSTEESACES